MRGLGYLRDPASGCCVLRPAGEREKAGLARFFDRRFAKRLTREPLGQGRPRMGRHLQVNLVNA